MSRIWTLGVFLLTACCAWPQSQSATYRIQEEDRLGISVFDEQQIQAVVVVTPDGNITAPFAGIVRAVGKTTSELETELADIYEKKLRLRNPRVSVTIVSVRSIIATISGAVQRAGLYPMRPGSTIADLVAQGNVDATSPVVDLRRATFRRKGWNESIPIDLYALMQFGNLSQNYEIQDGDQLNIPTKKDAYIRIWGEVFQPKNVPYEEGMNLVAAITAGGGAIPNRARQSRVLVVRRKPGTRNQYYMIQADLVAYHKKGDFAQNVLLQPGDTVYVPHNGNPNLDLFNSIANAVFILDRFGIGVFGSR